MIKIFYFFLITSFISHCVNIKIISQMKCLCKSQAMSVVESESGEHNKPLWGVKQGVVNLQTNI